MPWRLWSQQPTVPEGSDFKKPCRKQFGHHPLLLNGSQSLVETREPEVEPLVVDVHQEQNRPVEIVDEVLKLRPWLSGAVFVQGPQGLSVCTGGRPAESVA